MHARSVEIALNIIYKIYNFLESLEESTEIWIFNNFLKVYKKSFSKF